MIHALDPVVSPAVTASASVAQTPFSEPTGSRGAASRAIRFVDEYKRTHPVKAHSSRWMQWIFTHPGAVRVAQGTLAAVGAAAYAVGTWPAGPWAWALNATGLAAGGPSATQSKGGAVTAGVLGGVLPVAVNTVLGGPVAGLATGIGSALGAVLLGGALFEKVVAAPGYDTATYPYLDKQYGAGRLYHLAQKCEGRTVPVLELDARRPFSAGFSHGYLLGAQIKSLLDSFRHDLLAMPDAAKHFPKALGQLKDTLAPDEEAELRGLVTGFNIWAQEAGVTRRATFEEALEVQLLPDLCHFQWPRVEAGISRQATAHRDVAAPLLGCTAVMLRGADKNITWGRNMDWPAFGMGGAMSLPMVWKNHVSGHDYAVLGVPGMIGAVTGWNSEGLSLAMNVVGGDTQRVRGAPAGLFNRRLLRQASSVGDVANIAAAQTPRPLGPYHLMVADKSQGRCISFFQNHDKSHHVEELSDAPLWCLNWTHPGKRRDVFNSRAREVALGDYFQAAEKLGPTSGSEQATLVDGALQLGSTNHIITLHSVVFSGDDVSMRWSNGFAATRTAVTLSRRAFFDS